MIYKKCKKENKRITKTKEKAINKMERTSEKKKKA
jgi:hypothetical protein